jgi:NADPH-dependent 2,4-dienoyl-CoA reductase/sulfur reductase-like enzyme
VCGVPPECPLHALTRAAAPATRPGPPPPTPPLACSSESLKIVLFERGEYPSFANCGLPYYAGGVIAKRENLLVQTAAGLQARFAFDVRTRHEVTAIDRAAKTVAVRELASGRQFEQPYDVLILATGAKPLRPPIPGLEDAAAAGNLHTLRTIPDTDAIKARADALLAEAAAAPAGTPKPRAVVVGGGFIGEPAREGGRRGC